VIFTHTTSYYTHIYIHTHAHPAYGAFHPVIAVKSPQSTSKVMELVRGGELFDVIVSNKTGGGRGGRGGRGGPRGLWVLANSMDSMDGGELIRI